MEPSNMDCCGSESQGGECVEKYLYVDQERSLELLRGLIAQIMEDEILDYPGCMSGPYVVRCGIRERFRSFFQRDVRDVFKSFEDAAKAQAKRDSKDWENKIRHPQLKGQCFDFEKRLRLVMDLAEAMRNNNKLITSPLIREMIRILREHIDKWNPWWMKHEELKSFYDISDILGGIDSLEGMNDDMGKLVTAIWSRAWHFLKCSYNDLAN